jgi:hypothetical protein
VMAGLVFELVLRRSPADAIDQDTHSERIPEAPPPARLPSRAGGTGRRSLRAPVLPWVSLFRISEA